MLKNVNQFVYKHDTSSLWEKIYILLTELEAKVFSDLILFDHREKEIDKKIEEIKLSFAIIENKFLIITDYVSFNNSELDESIIKGDKIIKIIQDIIKKVEKSNFHGEGQQKTILSKLKKLEAKKQAIIQKIIKLKTTEILLTIEAAFNKKQTVDKIKPVFKNGQLWKIGDDINVETSKISVPEKINFDLVTITYTIFSIEWETGTIQIKVKAQEKKQNRNLEFLVEITGYMTLKEIGEDIINIFVQDFASKLTTKFSDKFLFTNYIINEIYTLSELGVVLEQNLPLSIIFKVKQTDTLEGLISGEIILEKYGFQKTFQGEINNFARALDYLPEIHQLLIQRETQQSPLDLKQIITYDKTWINVINVINENLKQNKIPFEIVENLKWEVLPEQTKIHNEIVSQNFSMKIEEYDLGTYTLYFKNFYKNNKKQILKILDQEVDFAIDTFKDNNFWTISLPLFYTENEPFNKNLEKKDLTFQKTYIEWKNDNTKEFFNDKIEISHHIYAEGVNLKKMIIESNFQNIKLFINAKLKQINNFWTLMIDINNINQQKMNDFDSRNANRQHLIEGTLNLGHLILE